MTQVVTKQDVVDAVNEAMSSHSIVSGTCHEEHHEWIKMQIEEQYRRDKRRQKIKEQVTGWAIIGALGAIAITAVDWIQFVLKKFIGE